MVWTRNWAESKFPCTEKKEFAKKRKKTRNFRAHACLEWTVYLNEWESFKTLSQGHNQHGGQDLCPMMSTQEYP